jgi:hypothetical protein
MPLATTTAIPTEMLSSTSTPTPPLLIVTTAPISPDISLPQVSLPVQTNVALGDLLTALGSIFLTSVAGIFLWPHSYHSLTARIRLLLMVFIGGMTGYVLYGIGWLRPDMWLAATISVLVQRLMLAALILTFSLLGYFIERQTRQ